MNMLALVISFFLSTLSFLVSIYTTIFQTRVDENCKLLRRVHLQSSGSKTRIQLQYLLPGCLAGRLRAALGYGNIFC